MELSQLEERYRRFIALMETGAAAIEQEDVEAVETVAQDSAVLLRELEAVWGEVTPRTGSAEDEAALVRLGQVMREALGRSDRNQRRIEQWVGQTQASLGAIAKGSAALAGYGGLGRQGDSSMSAQA
ncbi:MAG: hypothetical protein EPO64_03015 [Nitrospirae bacterium]|nr:MAG: hypothetical protein EPO64_03015 [Nitrospirota bacterium]